MNRHPYMNIEDTERELDFNQPNGHGDAVLDHENDDDQASYLARSIQECY